MRKLNLKSEKGKLKSKNFQFSILNSQFKNRGFTLVEMLVTIAILALMGAILTEVFVRSLRANNKARVLSVIKQNGQTAFESIDKALRNADRVICPPTHEVPSSILVFTKKSETDPPVVEAFRFRYVAPSGSLNGYITQDTPPASLLTQTSVTQSDCEANLNSPIKITDDNIKTGVSIIAIDPANGNPASAPFIRNLSTGFSDTVSISFEVAPGVSAPKAVTGQIDPVEFKTTVVLR
jgi:prepilin-type N-terminal cleavage/methylation domain-containing protein